MRYNPQIKRYYQRKCARTHRVVAIKTVAHKLARACYYILRDQALAVGMQEAEIAGTAKTFWQDMLEGQPQKRCPGNRPDLGQLALGVLIADR